MSNESQFAARLRAVLKERSKGEVETWGFVAAFMEMIDEVEHELNQKGGGTRGICPKCDLPFTDLPAHMTCHRDAPERSTHSGSVEHRCERCSGSGRNNLDGECIACDGTGFKGPKSDAHIIQSAPPVEEWRDLERAEIVKLLFGEEKLGYFPNLVEPIRVLLDYNRRFVEERKEANNKAPVESWRDLVAGEVVRDTDRQITIWHTHPNDSNAEDGKRIWQRRVERKT